jgi:hypothetical protein
MYDCMRMYDTAAAAPETEQQEADTSHAGALKGNTPINPTQPCTK